MRACMLLVLTASVLSLNMFPAVVSAQDAVGMKNPQEKIEAAPEAGAQAGTPEAQNKDGGDSPEDPRKRALLDKIVKITTSLDQAQANHFFVMYSNYAMISTVKKVEGDVKNAAQKCSETNPDMKDKIASRLDGWTTAINAPMKDATDNINNMSLAQTYISQAEVQEIFALVDTMREETDQKFQRVPVSTPEACEFMLSKLDETQQNMGALLKATLMSYPNVLQKTQE